MTKREFHPHSASSNARHSLVTWFGQPDKFRIAARDGFNATVVKEKPAVLIGWYIVNLSIGVRQVRFYDQATEPTKEDPVDWILTIAPDSPSVAEFALQIPYFRGLAFTLTTADGAPAREGNLEGVLLYA